MPIRKSLGERGVVGVNLVLTIAFALYAVIMLSRTTLAAKQIDDRVRVIVTEVGPGSNVSRLDETQKLNSIGKTAEDIEAAAKPLSAQAQMIIDTAKSIDNTVSAINTNAAEINSTVHSINATTAALVPVVKSIHGDETLDDRTGGVAAINKRAASALGSEVVPGIRNDLHQILIQVGGNGPGAHTPNNTIHSHVNSINCALTSPSGGLVGLVGGLLNTLLGGLSSTPAGCGQ